MEKLHVFILLLTLWSTYAGESRIDCYPEPGASQEACQQRGCTWDESTVTGSPWCHYGSKPSGYKLAAGGTSTSAVLTADPNGANPYYDNLPQLNFTSSMIGVTLNIRISAEGRYEPPVHYPRGNSVSSSNEALSVSINSNAPGGNFAFTVVRKGVTIWDTSIGGMLFGDKFIQIATYLPTSNIYGFGEHIHKRIKHNMNRYTTWPMFTRDIGPDSYSELSTLNLYGVHPFYMAVEDDGSAHGVLILNSDAQEVTLGPGPHLVYRTIGGILDIYFFPGPSPEEVIKQYQALIGTPIFPAYWALGFQLCRWGYENFQDMANAVSRTRNAGIPLEIVVVDIDYMDVYKDFSLGWPELTNYTEQLHQDGLHVTLMTDPAVEVDYGPFERARNMNASFIEWPDGSCVDHNVTDRFPLLSGTLIMPGNVWPENTTAMPDFLDETNITLQWWSQEFANFKSNIVNQDNIWIDMNEPSNFDTDPTNSTTNDTRLKCSLDDEYNNPKYLTYAAYVYGDGNYLFTKTLCPQGMTARRTHRLYDTHNLYGYSMAVAAAQVMRDVMKTRGGLISRSTFPGSGHYTGHWLGDNTARWADLQTSVIGAQEMNMFGMTYTGSDICGFNGDTTEELCLRWHQMGAFHTYSRNHNAQGQIRQDPGQWPDTVAVAARQAVFFKYHYLPYLYTLLYDAHINGGTVLRPVFFEFPTDPNTYDIGHQFLWGSGMMIIPVVEQGAVSVMAYLPDAKWYSLREDQDYGVALPSRTAHLFSATWTEMIPVLARGGTIIPRQQGATVIRDARKNPLELLIALPSDGLEARGKLFWDDGDSYLTSNNYYLFDITYRGSDVDAAIQFNATNICTSNCEFGLPSLQMIEVMGYQFSPNMSQLTIEGAAGGLDTWNYNATTQLLRLNFTQPFSLTAVSRISWSHTSSSPSPPTSTSPTVSPVSPESTVSPTPGKASTEGLPIFSVLLSTFFLYLFL